MDFRCGCDRYPGTGAELLQHAPDFGPGHPTLAVVPAIDVVYSAMWGPEGGLISVQFPPEVRYGGLSISGQVGAEIGAGLPPIVATSLLAYGHGDPPYNICYLSIPGVIAIICAMLMHGPTRFSVPASAEGGVRP